MSSKAKAATVALRNALRETTPRERKLEHVMEAIYAEIQNEGVGSSEQLDMIEEFVEGILTKDQKKRVLKRMRRWNKGSYL